MDIKCRHLCRVGRNPLKAGIFEIKISEPLETFEGAFKVALYAIASSSGKETKIGGADRSINIINKVSSYHCSVSHSRIALYH